MVEEKLLLQICNILEKFYATFYSCRFSRIFKSYEITLIGFSIKKTPCVGKPSKDFFVVVGEGISGCSI